MRRLLFAFALVCSAILPATALATPNDPNGSYTPNGQWASNSFQSPTGNIKCHYWTAGSLDGILTCTTLNTGLTIYLDGYGSASSRYAHLAEGHGPTLRYGEHWGDDDTDCASRFTGMTCTSSSGHGFFVSRAAYRTW